MANWKPLTTSELRHCDRFCFNDGVCIGCMRDPHAKAQCIGCTCPQHLWTGERCEIRVGYLGMRSTEDTLYILTVIFALLAILMSISTIYFYLKGRRFRQDPFIIPGDPTIHLSIQPPSDSDKHYDIPQPLVTPGNA
ncbi:unnamed protein product [Rodentolepis nana]|uniref:EGF-like domain-containing protein n=1 Tax=Rodentolepis nana TaxID=102285 RepID=A0A0R3TUT4_RODNA|nr:unnamed protein product [Rodentolepis nana]